MKMYDVIKRKRDSQELSSAEIAYVVEGAVTGTIADYQLTALLMAIFLRGMSDRETAELTTAIAASGTQITLDIQKAVDKHSTGGVGDTTTLIVAPVVAACGVPVAKMTGRGLGHTGGTVDKLESIPGFSAVLSSEQFKAQVAKIGLALISASAELAPADKVLYALRDVTATVESIPLIASSIMSKKIAAGATHIVLDVKHGRGAFMQEQHAAELLATTMVEIGRRVGRPTTAVLTSMEAPLGNAIGNALEIKEAVAVLSGNGGSPDLRIVSLAVAREMVLHYYPQLSLAAAQQMVEHALVSGAAMQKFTEVVVAQGGNLARALPAASLSYTITAPHGGYVAAIDPLALGSLAVDLGAGRRKKDDAIDYGAGMVLHVRVGTRVTAGQPLLTAYASRVVAAETQAALGSAFRITDNPVTPPPLILKTIPTTRNAGNDSF
ncbi:MAG: Pyrimidine-nucleoside phosphorylase [Firmicutes bacterium]|nr:Pyrimidine-nucleoside phosphorylase [candidate division NPL-UPA2 bacterium]